MNTFLIFLQIILLLFLIFTVGTPGIPVGSAKNRQLLLSALSQLTSLEKGQFKQLPPYKFFDQVVQEAMRLRIQIGFNIRPLAKELREALLRDGQSERKLNETIKGLLTQYGLFMLMICLFITYSQTILGLGHDYEYYLLIVGWMTLGILFTLVLLRKLRHQGLKRHQDYFRYLYLLRIMLSKGLPLSQIQQQGSTEGSFPHGEENYDLYQSSQSLLAEMRESGRSVVVDLQYLIDELWFRFEQYSEKTITRISYLKLITLPVFFFLPYLYHLYTLSQQITNQW